MTATSAMARTLDAGPSAAPDDPTRCRGRESSAATASVAPGNVCQAALA